MSDTSPELTIKDLYAKIGLLVVALDLAQAELAKLKEDKEETPSGKEA